MEKEWRKWHDASEQASLLAQSSTKNSQASVQDVDTVPGSSEFFFWSSGPCCSISGPTTRRNSDLWRRSIRLHEGFAATTDFQSSVATLILLFTKRHKTDPKDFPSSFCEVTANLGRAMAQQHPVSSNVADLHRQFPGFDEEICHDILSATGNDLAAARQILLALTGPVGAPATEPIDHVADLNRRFPSCGLDLVRDVFAACGSCPRAASESLASLVAAEQVAPAPSTEEDRDLQVALARFGPGADDTPRSAAAVPLVEEPAPSVLVLVGAPGSGKSTFAKALTNASPRWNRVNQDSINGGQPGSRQQCEEFARRCLMQGKSIIVDRCNFNAQQRRTWVDLAREFSCHCDSIFLDLPLEVCKDRVARRVGHEGGVQGSDAATRAIVTRMGNLLEPVRKGEGFRHSTTCTTPSAVTHALRALLAPRPLP
mmetsp:Transcript_33363/g.76239  ORF Transcript_33363/g.76239 Transcript_33363/m.76239 type:complete len:428 (-) Transcript_33363:190-1473(-)